MALNFLIVFKIFLIGLEPTICLIPMVTRILTKLDVMDQCLLRLVVVQKWVNYFFQMIVIVLEHHVCDWKEFMQPANTNFFLCQEIPFHLIIIMQILIFAALLLQIGLQEAAAVTNSYPVVMKFH